MAAQQVFGETARIDAYLMEFVPEECKVVDASRGVSAGIEFKCDSSGNIIDKTYLNLVADNVYEGSKAVYRITLWNFSEFALTADDFRLKVDEDNCSLADLIYFSGSVIIVKDDEYENLLGTFEDVGLYELDDTLSGIMEYKKIEANEKVVFEISQQLDKSRTKLIGKTGLSYELIPVFVQYFPLQENSQVARSDTDGL
jgi:hypothetical protein